MQKSSPQPPKGGFGVQDILFVLFKHKWKIILFTLAGLAAAAYVWTKQEPVYISTSKLLIRYVRESGGAIDPYEAMKSPGGGARGMGDPVINTEIEIIKSLDLAMEVAEQVGLEKLLPEAGNPTLADGASAVLGGLLVAPGQSANVLYIIYSHKNSELSKLVLEKVVEVYFKKHLEIHRSRAAFEVVSTQTKEVKAKLQQTEEKLAKLRTQSGIMNLADATAALISQKSKTQEDLMAAKIELVEFKAGAAEEEAEIPKALPVGEEPKPNAKPPASVLTEYKTLIELLEFFRKRDIDLKTRYMPGNRLLVLNQQQINANEAKRKDLVARFPALADETVAVPDANGKVTNDPSSRKARIAAIEAKIKIFNDHLAEINEKFKKDYMIGKEIEDLERQRQMEETEFRASEADLKNEERKADLDPSRMPNITLVQQPSKPLQAYDELTKKIAFGLAGGGLALGVGLAFLIELLLDRRVKRPIEIQTRLQLPLLLSIPYIRRKERGGLLMSSDSSVPRIGAGEDLALSTSGSEELAIENTTKKLGHFILPYSETIRDRIIFNFEVNNVTHKPKLVAVTGLSEGAGASTVAAGVAKSFSEIPGMKVLLVDLSSYHPEENPLFGEIPRHSLNGALHLARNTQFRENPQNLYYASATARRDETGLTTFSPVHLYELMPHLQASQYDYIVFDMPPIDQTSRTLTMAGLMDKVLLVLDAENTSRDGLMWGYSELVKGRADVSCIFNKTRSHVPGWLNGSM